MWFTRLPYFLPSLSVLVFLLCFEECRTASIVNDDTLGYLKKYGYLEGSTNYKTGSASSEAAVTNALLEFQRFAGVRQTGELDSATLEVMTVPRCGVKDISEDSQLARRRKRYALQGSRWRVNKLTYRVSKYPSKISDRQLVDNAIAQGFKLWSDVTQLSFEEKKEGRVDIEIKFEARDHGDGDPFDGPEKTLAHAFFPQYGGDVHFDDEETWTFDETLGIDLLQIATHEFGHSLGLQHSDERMAVMTPFYWSYRRSFKLHTDDVTGIQSLYGDDNSCVCNKPNDEDEPSCPPRDISDAPDLCQDGAIDAATRTENGNSYVFKGNFYWKVLENGIADGYPRRISDDWDGLPGNLDAALMWSNGKTFFFKGGRYWSFTNRKMDKGYPQLISVGFEGLPDNLDAAFVWSGNGDMYFFKGDQYWKYEINGYPPVHSNYPLPINLWTGIPNNIDAAIQWGNNKTYFFKDDKYYRFNDTGSMVDNDPEYPLSTSVFWFDCRSTAKQRIGSASHGMNGPDPNLRPRSSPVYEAHTSASHLHYFSLSLLLGSLLLCLVW